MPSDVLKTSNGLEMALYQGFGHKKGRQWTSLVCYMVPMGGLEPPLLAQMDFESIVYTNFTTPALKWGDSNAICLFVVGLQSNNKAKI
jgi:hypothetical protein